MIDSFAAKKVSVELARIGRIAAIVTGMTIGLHAGRISPAYSDEDVKPIAGIQCDREEYSIFHIHAHLDIFVDGQPYTVPELVGIIPSHKCLYWMHTHDRSGIIHIEAPRTRAFTLGQFFDIWKATAKGMPVMKEEPKVFVNGKRASGRLEQVEISPFSEIGIVYGKEPSAIPSFYDFPAVFRKDGPS